MMLSWLAVSKWLVCQRATFKKSFVLLTILMVMLFLIQLLYVDRKRGGGFVEPSPRTLVLGNEHLRYVDKLNVTSNDQWIVLDVTYGTCERILRAPAGWKILVTGEARQSVGCSSPTCMTLTLEPDLTQGITEEQKRVLGKNLVYLTAVSGGALRILEADCSVSLDRAVQTLQIQPGKDYGLMYNETLLFNPYTHFGAWAAVPRAVGGQDGTDNARLYYIRNFDAVLVKHGLSETSQDVIVRDAGRRQGASFDPYTPPVFLSQKSFSTALPAASMFDERAFWGLLLPCLSPGLRCLVLRQLIVQRLLRELDAFSGFYQIHTSSEHAGQSQGPGHVDAIEIARALDAWNCTSKSKFFRCFSDMADYLLTQSHLDRYEHFLIKTWIAALRKVGAVEPVRVSSPWRGVRKTSEVRATLGSMQTRLESGGSKEEQYLKEQFVETVESLCNRTDAERDWFPVAQWIKPLIKDVVMVVVFNSNRFFWNNLPFLETVHRPFFKHIVYCVPSIDELLRGERNKSLEHVSFVEGMSDRWFLLHECLTTVTFMNFQGVRGYLHVADDTLLNTWTFLHAPRDSFLMPQGGHILRADDVDFKGWMWWDTRFGRSAIVKAMAGLERLSGLSAEQLLGSTLGRNQSSMLSREQLVKVNQRVKTAWQERRRMTTFTAMYLRKRAEAASLIQLSLVGSEVWPEPTQEEAVTFLNNYYHHHHMAGLVQHTAMDFFYIPQLLVERFASFSRFFLKHGVLVELAVPTLMYGVARGPHLKVVPCSILWYGKHRANPHTFFNYTHTFIHPFKFKANLELKDPTDFFCRVYMETLMSELEKNSGR